MRLLTIVLISIISHLAAAQGVISGKIQNWSNPAAPIVNFDMSTGASIEIGRVDNNGEFTIDLVDDYLTISKLRFEEAEKQSTSNSGWSEKEKTIENTFACGNGKLNYENGSIKIGNIPEILPIADVPNKKMYGTIQAVSDEEFGDYFSSFGRSGAVKGYYLMWVYSESIGSVNGTCSISNYTGNGDENFIEYTYFELEIDQGWNIIKYQIEDLHKDSNGVSHPSKISYSRIDEVPEDIFWYFSPRN